MTAPSSSVILTRRAKVSRNTIHQPATVLQHQLSPNFLPPQTADANTNTDVEVEGFVAAFFTHCLLYTVMVIPIF